MDMKKIFPTIAGLIVWVLSIPINAVPIFLKYLTDETACSPWYQYILSDKECTFVFVSVSLVLLMEGGYFYYKGKSWETVVSWLIRIMTILLLFTAIINYIPNVTNSMAWAKNMEKQYCLNKCFLVTIVLLGLFGHVFACIRRIVGDD